MQFKPKTEKEIASEGLLEKGIYDAEVMTASEEISKKENPMLKVKMRVFRPNGGEAHIFDYLLESVAYKLRHFAYAIGLGDAYERGELEADNCERRPCQVEVGIDNKNPDYPPKNVIKDYITPDKEQTQATPKASSSSPKAAPNPDKDGDDIPF